MPLLPTLVLIAWCAALSWFDLRERRLPNALTLTGAAAVLLYAISRGESAAAMAGGLLLAGPYLLMHLANPAALGAGDVKLALGLGASTALAGPQPWAIAALTAPLLTAAAGLGAVMTRITLGERTRSLDAPYRLPLRNPWPVREFAGQACLADPANNRPGDVAPAGRGDLKTLVAMLRRGLVLGGFAPVRGWVRATPPVPDARQRLGVPDRCPTLAHGPAMCAASVVALLATR